MSRPPKQPPPGPADEGFWFSPLRGPWLTAALGSLLLVALLVVGVTGFLSHAAYSPDLGRNAVVPRNRDLQWFIFSWPASPSWLYRATQGAHVTVGMLAVPLLLAKLWSVIPRLFTWPPVRSPAHALERLTLLALVGGAIFQLATGLCNVALFYPFHFNFVVAHYYGAWILLAALALHVAVKLPDVRRAFRTRGLLKPLLDAEAARVPEPYVPGGLAPPDPEPATLSRRGFFGVLGGSMGALFLVSAGQSVGGPLRALAILSPRGTESFPVNKTAALARVTPAMVGDAWRLRLIAGPRTVELTRDDLLAMEQHTRTLPIACVEGWSTTHRWTGVRLADLAARVGRPDARTVHVQSLQPAGAFRQTTLDHAELHADASLLALEVDGRDLPLDHGYPARIIVPALPGVHCTKWVGALEFA